MTYTVIRAILDAAAHDPALSERLHAVFADAPDAPPPPRGRYVSTRGRVAVKYLSYSYRDNPAGQSRTRFAATKPAAHYEGGGNIGEYIFVTTPSVHELADVFTLRGWRWRRDPATVAVRPGVTAWVWRREARGRRIADPRWHYHNAVGQCGCREHHPPTETCVACRDVPQLPGDVERRIAEAAGVDAVCHVAKLTRCHAVGAAAGGLGAVYLPCDAESWGHYQDRRHRTSARGRIALGEGEYPRAVPAVKRLRIECEYPYYPLTAEPPSSQTLQAL